MGGGNFNTNLLTPLGGTGVAIFLCLSGYGLNESFKKNGLQKYWKKKIIRVFVPYFILQTICIYWSADFEWKSYLLDIFGIKTDYWYIGFLLKQYILFWIATRFFYKYRIAVMGICAVWVLFFFRNIEAEQAFSFLSGVIVSKHINQIRNWSNKRILYIGICALIIGVLFLAFKQLPAIRAHEHDYIYNLVQCGIKLPLGVFFMAAFSLFPFLLQSRFLIFTGNISYELYLVHMKLLPVLSVRIWDIVLFFILSFVISFVFYRLNKVTAEQFWRFYACCNSRRRE